MPTSCCAYNCNERSKSGGSIAFHRFPTKNEMLFRAWCVALRRKDFHPTWASRVCSKHFTKDSYEDGFKTRKLKRGAVPSIFNFGKRAFKINLNSKRIKRISSCYKSVDFQNSSVYDIPETSSEGDTVAETPKTVEIIKLSRDNDCEESGMEWHQEQFEMPENTADKTIDATATSDKIVTFDNLPSDQVANIENENEILRQTIHHLNQKINRFKCLTNVLHSNDLISKASVEVLRVKFLSSDEVNHMQNENEILRQTIHQLNQKIKSFKCLINVLHLNDVISDEAAEVLRCAIDM